jgi:hypothetical protein
MCLSIYLGKYVKDNSSLSLTKHNSNDVPMPYLCGSVIDTAKGVIIILFIYVSMYL